MSLSSYWGFCDARISASDKDIPVCCLKKQQMPSPSADSKFVYSNFYVYSIFSVYSNGPLYVV